MNTFISVLYEMIKRPLFIGYIIVISLVYKLTLTYLTDLAI